MTNLHKSLRRVFTIIIGLVFFISGFIKLLDPVGAGLVMTEYFDFFGTEFLDFAAPALGVLLALFETILGVALVTGVFRKISAILTFSLLSFFTLITLILVIFNPEMDCGCFGEAVHLSHFQTFLKNVILAAMSLFAFLPLREYGVPQKKKYVAFGLVSVFAVAMLVYTALTIPVTDFTTFRLSSRLSVAEEFNADGSDRYIATFVYEKNGQEGTFTLDNLPDSTWTFVRTETVLRQENFAEMESPSLSFSDAEGVYFDHLAASGVVMIVSVYAPDRLSSDRWNGISDFVHRAEANGFTALVLVRGDGTDYSSRLPGTTVYSADYKTLISLNRSNGGVSYFNEGYLVERWALRNMPDDKRLASLEQHDATDLMLSISTKGRLMFQASFLYSFAVMLLI